MGDEHGAGLEAAESGDAVEGPAEEQTGPEGGGGGEADELGVGGAAGVGGEPAADGAFDADGETGHGVESEGSGAESGGFAFAFTGEGVVGIFAAEPDGGGDGREDDAHAGEEAAGAGETEGVGGESWGEAGADGPDEVETHDLAGAGGVRRAAGTDHGDGRHGDAEAEAVEGEDGQGDAASYNREDKRRDSSKHEATGGGAAKAAAAEESAGGGASPGEQEQDAATAVAHAPLL